METVYANDWHQDYMQAVVDLAFAHECGQYAIKTQQLVIPENGWDSLSEAIRAEAEPLDAMSTMTTDDGRVAYIFEVPYGFYSEHFTHIYPIISMIGYQDSPQPEND